MKAAIRFLLWLVFWSLELAAVAFCLLSQNMAITSKYRLHENMFNYPFDFVLKKVLLALLVSMFLTLIMLLVDRLFQSVHLPRAFEMGSRRLITLHLGIFLSASLIGGIINATYIFLST